MILELVDTVPRSGMDRLGAPSFREIPFLIATTHQHRVNPRGNVYLTSLKIKTSVRGRAANNIIIRAQRSLLNE